MTINACFPVSNEAELLSSIEDSCYATISSSLEIKTSPSFSTFKRLCGGNLSLALSAQWSIDRSQLYSTALPFHPIFQPEHFATQYELAMREINELHQNLIRMNVYDDASMDAALESLSLLDQALATTEDTISGIEISPPSIAIRQQVEIALIGLEKFSNSLLSDERLYQLLTGLNERVSNYHGKYPKTELVATLAKWIDHLKYIYGAELTPDKKLELAQTRSNLTES